MDHERWQVDLPKVLGARAVGEHRFDLPGDP
jgi:hypothetical protein